MASWEVRRSGPGSAPAALDLHHEDHVDPMQQEVPSRQHRPPGSRETRARGPAQSPPHHSRPPTPARSHGPPLTRTGAPHPPPPIRSTPPLQAHRRAACRRARYGLLVLCSTGSRAEPATHQWPQYASQDVTGTELARLQRQAAVPGHSTRLDLSHHLAMTVAVFGCDTHKLAPDARYPVVANSSMPRPRSRVSGSRGRRCRARRSRCRRGRGRPAAPRRRPRRS
jgi:hypothetical protein